MPLPLVAAIGDIFRKTTGSYFFWIDGKKLSEISNAYPPFFTVPETISKIPLNFYLK
jgi:hypothetical protein